MDSFGIDWNRPDHIDFCPRIVHDFFGYAAALPVNEGGANYYLRVISFRALLIKASITPLLSQVRARFSGLEGFESRLEHHASGNSKRPRTTGSGKERSVQVLRHRAQDLGEDASCQ